MLRYFNPAARLIDNTNEADVLCDLIRASDEFLRRHGRDSERQSAEGTLNAARR
jgi:hypothetical protein